MNGIVVYGNFVSIELCSVIIKYCNGVLNFKILKEFLKVRTYQYAKELNKINAEAKGLFYAFNKLVK